MAKKHTESKRFERNDELPDDQNSFYSNAVNVMTSVYDVTIQFRTQTPITTPAENQPVLIEAGDICNVRMSPQHAKALVAILAKHIMEYEQGHRVKLPLPPDMQNLWDKVFRTP